MTAARGRPEALETAGGPIPLQEYHLRLAGRAWAILHAGAVLTRDDESRVIGESRERLPYGIALWPAAIALAHEVAARAADLRGAPVLELGAGAGLPGIVAASLGARVTQTDRQETALALCRRNGTRNGLRAVAYRLADWGAWDDAARYAWIVGADILYDEAGHEHLRRIFEANLAPGGRILLADPFRAVSLGLLEALEADGWAVALSTWRVGEADAERPIGLFELTPPR